MTSLFSRHREFLFGYFILFAIFLTYFFGLPFTVQLGGDSAEMAYAAKGFLVPHPPGYPLWVGLGHLWLKIFPVSEVFYSLAIFNFLCSIGCLVTIYIFSRNQIIGILGVLFLAMDCFYWRYSVIPEVFSLHALLLALILLWSSSEKTFSLGKIAFKYSNLVPLVFFLGTLNHLTIVFVVPVILWRAWKNRRDPMWYIASALGFSIFIAGYSSLLLFETEHIYSWGDLKKISDVWAHFLRKDYGTFSLSGIPFSIEMTRDVYLFFFNHIIASWILYFSTAIVLIICLKRSLSLSFKISSFQMSVSICFFAYIILFFGRANIPTVTYGLDTIGRFTIMPSILMVFFIQDFFRNISTPKKWGTWISVGAIVFFSFNIFKYGATQDFSGNTILEDYAINFLDIAAKENSTLLIVPGDAELYSLRYVQTVLGHPSKTVVVNSFNINYKWFGEKMRRIPNFSLKEMDGYDAVNDLFIPNIADNKFLVAKNFSDSSKVKISFLPLGRLVSQGSGTEVVDRTYFVPHFRSGIDVISTPIEKFDPYRDIFAQYAYFFLAQGLKSYSQGSEDDALISFERALALVPYCAPALKNICAIKERKKQNDPRCNSDSYALRAYPYFSSPY